MRVETIRTDVLIIGGGTAGCYAAGKLSEKGFSVVIAEKANIERSGCLASGINALNAYITPGHTPQDYVDYAREDARGIVREDLLFTMSRRLNQVTEDLERMGLTILKDEKGNYVSRGWRNLKINGENIKPLLARYARSHPGVRVLNHVNVTDYLTEEKEGEIHILGAVGFDTREDVFYCLYGRVVLIATGGASGIYRPNNPGSLRHRMWYCPFNTGAGYAMGLLSGAEMTTFEMRYIALRCRDTLSPVGTLAQGVGAVQINSRGEAYEEKYGNTTAQRVWGTVEENREGRGPCYLKTEGITREQESELYLAYLNMAPIQTFKWLSSGEGPSAENVELDSSEPYIVGGHTASGYWVSTGRETTIRGLFAAGDVCGGAPQKYVTGVLAEALIAAESIEKRLKNRSGDSGGEGKAGSVLDRYRRFFSGPGNGFSACQLEEAMQKTMDAYAGGIRTDYGYNRAGLATAEKKIRNLLQLSEGLHADSMHDLLGIYELRDRLVTARALIAHLGARKETRWHTFQENRDYPEEDPKFDLYVNSRMRQGEIEILYRPLTEREGWYEHTH